MSEVVCTADLVFRVRVAEDFGLARCRELACPTAALVRTRVRGALSSASASPPDSSLSPESSAAPTSAAIPQPATPENVITDRYHGSRLTVSELPAKEQPGPGRFVTDGNS